MSDENLAEIRNEKAKKIQHPKGKLTAYERLDLLLDEGSFSEIDQHVALKIQVVQGFKKEFHLSLAMPKYSKKM